MSPKVLIFGGKGGNPHLVQMFRAAHPELDITAAASLEEAEDKMPEAEIFMCWGLPRDIFTRAAKLKWISGLGTGVNGVIDAPSLDGRDVVITATRGIHGVPMSEAAFLAMLALARRFVDSVRLQDLKKWERLTPELLSGKNVGIVGTGSIAQAFAPRCKAFGMQTTGFSRSVREIAGFDLVLTRQDLAATAGRLDFLVLLVPLDAESKGLVGEKVLAAMKPTSFVINLARGAIIDEDALLAALKDGRIAGAALDTFNEEPLPPEHPYWTAPNTIVTTHLGGHCNETDTNIIARFSQNLQHYLAGHPEEMANRER